jgi:amino acid transporter
MTEPSGTNIEGEAPVAEEAVEGEGVTRHEDDVELERTIGLSGAVAIGVGTMIGAGIFVFPGIAAGRAGPAASASFAVGAVVALLVALPASELATAMPRSGGGYYFISRGMGTVAGTVVGIGLWLGLVFASAFYLVGFGEYLSALVGFDASGFVVGSAVVAGVVLTAVSLTGTENVAKIQNVVVALLLSILVAFLAYGAADALGAFGSETVPERYAPYGYGPVLSTAALVFTSYLGFAQIATVAGEVKNPARNLPLGMVGSVVAVGIMYVVTVFVATSAVGSEALRGYGETAVVEVARELLGAPGALAVVGAGLLATVSSANASVLASSRAVFALSRDALLPRRAADVNLRYGTPHIALALAGGPVVLLAATGRVEVLAEVASFLHLVMYGLICFALIALRRSPPDWYDPDFRTPLYPVVPLLGGAASFALIYYMQRASKIVGGFVMLAAAAWYAYYADDVSLRGAV